MIIGIIIGFVVGTLTGIFTMSIMTAGRENERLAETYSPDREYGKWQEVEDYNGDVLFECSCCGTAYDILEGTPQDNGYKYCPSCGACLMVGEVSSV